MKGIKIGFKNPPRMIIGMPSLVVLTLYNNMDKCHCVIMIFFAS